MKGIGLFMGNKKCGYRYSDEDLRQNFICLYDELGHIPLFNEFRELSKISDITYATRFGLKGKVYDKIVQTYVTESEYEEYLKTKSEHKTSVGKKTGALSTWYSEEWLETHFRYIFDICMNKYGTYPSRRYFDKVAITDSRNYRKRFNKSWTEICKMYGYETQQKNIEETICLNMCKSILNEDYESQKTWDWLIGYGGKHMYCDGYFLNLNLVIEFDGSGHRIPIKKFGGYERMIHQQENDKLKDKLLSEHGIHIIRIDSRMDWQFEEKLKDYLLSNLSRKSA